MSTRADIVARLREAGVVAVLRAESADELADIANALLTGGVTAIEVTTTTPDAVSVPRSPPVSTGTARQTYHADRQTNAYTTNVGTTTSRA